MGSSTENSAFQPHAQSVGHDAHSRRFFGRLGGGGRCGRMPRCAGLGYRRLDSPAGGVVRLRGAEADLWPRLALRAGGVRVVAGSDRIFHQGRARRRDDAARRSAGTIARDSTSVPQPVPDYAAALTGDIKGLKLGLPKEYMIGGLDPEVKQAVEAAVKQLAEAGR